MNYISMDSSQDIIEHYGIKGMKWGLRSRHSGLKDRHTQYKKSKKLYSQAVDALMTHGEQYRNLAMGRQFDMNADKHLYKSEMYAHLYKEKTDKAKKKGKNIAKKTADKLKKRSDDAYENYVVNATLANKYYDKHNAGL